MVNEVIIRIQSWNVEIALDISFWKYLYLYFKIKLPNLISFPV